MGGEVKSCSQDFKRNITKQGSYNEGTGGHEPEGWKRKGRIEESTEKGDPGPFFIVAAGNTGRTDFYVALKFIARNTHPLNYFHPFIPP
ncbi:hypothetical protein KM043_017173 [Ampulex compressa]|nr:hypothetical protein KM043_017173 [Ampulex compressa]